MNKVLGISLGFMLVALSTAQAPLFLYSPGRTAVDQGIGLVSWGSGTIVETDEAAYEGTTSIRISTRNFFQGGVMNFSRVLDLSRAWEDPNNLLMLAVRLPDSSTTMGGGAAGGDASFGGADMSGGGGGAASGPGRAGDGGARGLTGAGAGSGSGNKADTLRILLTTTDGKRSESYIALNTSRPNERGWIQVGLPLRAISGFTNSNKVIQALAISANMPASVFVGEARIVNDSTPIYGEMMLSDMNIGSGTAINLVANGFAGATVLKYTWNIQGADGRTFQFDGQSIQRNFRKPGTFRVSVTISDIFGLKKSFTTPAATVTVN